MSVLAEQGPIAQCGVFPGRRACSPPFLACKAGGISEIRVVINRIPAMGSSKNKKKKKRPAPWMGGQD